MPLRKYLYDGLVILLLLMNIGEGIYILKASLSRHRKTEIDIQNQLAAVSAFHRAGVLKRDVQEMLDSCIVLNAMGSADLFVFVPKEACRACVDIQNAILFDAASSYSEKQVIVLVPGDVRRDYAACFSGLKRVRIEEYEADLSAYEHIVSDGYLYFTVHSGGVEDFFLSDKAFPETTRLFLQNVLG